MSQGRLANAYANLVQSLWAAGRKKSLNPRSFKVTIAKLNSQFAGNDQHDAQELLSFLLSGLSEDLNRIADKPYIEQPDRCVLAIMEDITVPFLRLRDVKTRCNTFLFEIVAVQRAWCREAWPD